MLKYTFIFFFIISNLTFGQNSKDQTETYVKKFKKVLKKKKIHDFFVVKHLQYGLGRLVNLNEEDYCEKKQYHYSMYAFWKENDEYWLKVFDNCGGFVPIKLNNGKILEFYNQNFEKLKVEEVEKYKLKPDSIIKGKKYSFVSSQSHSPLRYFWFFKNSLSFKKFFDKYCLTTDEKSPNIVYQTNNNLALVKLNEMCEDVIKEYSKTIILVRDK